MVLIRVGVADWLNECGDIFQLIFRSCIRNRRIHGRPFFPEFLNPFAGNVSLKCVTGFSCSSNKRGRLAYCQSGIRLAMSNPTPKNRRSQVW